jgi:hypothetical protein
MFDWLFDNGGRKLWLVLVAIVIAVLNATVGLGVDAETIKYILLAAVGGSVSIAAEDGVRAIADAKTAAAASDLLGPDEPDAKS